MLVKIWEIVSSKLLTNVKDGVKYMDYLRGRSNIKKPEKKEKPIPQKPNMTLFEKFIESAFSMISSDMKAQLYQEYMTDAIVSVLKDDDLYSCIEAFFKNNLNIAETSRNAYLHRNTLIYRLDKIEKATGLNIRKFSDAVTFRLITVLSKLVR